MGAVIFSGPRVKTLKTGIQLKDQATIWSGPTDPSIAGFTANLGDLYISTSTDKLYQKFDASDTSWREVPQVVSGDIYPSSFTALDNQDSPQNITGLTFSNSVTRSFTAMVSITRGSSFEQIRMDGVQKGSQWDYTISSLGDETGVTLSITNSGQVQYTTTNTGSNATLNFRASVTQV